VLTTVSRFRIGSLGVHKRVTIPCARMRDYHQVLVNLPRVLVKGDCAGEGNKDIGSTYFYTYKSITQVACLHHPHALPLLSSLPSHPLL
jgi:hypothetical protein